MTTIQSRLRHMAHQYHGDIRALLIDSADRLELLEWRLREAVRNEETEALRSLLDRAQGFIPYSSPLGQEVVDALGANDCSS